MSDTPQTDVMVSNGASSYTWAESHRVLEARLTAMTAERAKLAAGITAVLELIQASTGVYGLHLNGQFVTWKELRTGGWSQEWLSPFDDALAAMKGE